MPKAISTISKNNNHGKSTSSSSSANNNNNSSRAARAEVFQALHAEMELADYAIGTSGHKVKRVPRSQAPTRTAKRKALQEADEMEMAIEADDDDCYYEGGDGNGGNNDASSRRKRLRGSKVAFDDVVLKSMPLLLEGGTSKKANNNGKIEDDDDEEKEEDDDLIEDDERYEVLQEVAALGIDLGEEGGEEEIDEDDSTSEYVESEDEDEEVEEEEEEELKATKSRSTKTTYRAAKASSKVSENGLIVKAKTTTNKRLLHRLKDFSSKRLAEKHGEAIGAHIQGMSETAVQKLREVAKSAPGAPQVYSSLGMVFESMLTEIGEEEGGTANDDHAQNRHQGKDDEMGGGKNSQLELLQHRMELAQKAYASYHIASLLTKRDFVLWERSGDAAIRVADIYSEIIIKSDIISSGKGSYHAIQDAASRKGFDPSAGPDKWHADRKLWIEHALAAYQASDNLRPPGVDIPCKLAQSQIALGNYIDALSILTDLRNKTSEKSSSDEKKVRRSEMEGSYPCWLLYADLMMKIGYECKQWNDGKFSANQHQMLKRWLKKNAKNFDWGERRLQALCLALEAAAGSASCVKLIQWMRERALKYHVDIEKEDTTADDDDNDDEDESTNTKEKNPVDKDVPKPKSTYEEEREKLLNVNKMELEQFDRMTRQMNLVAGSHIHKNRIASRVALVEKHRTTMKEMAMRKLTDEQQNSSNEQQRFEGELSPNPLPLQGSCATVYDIAALILGQCIQLKLFNGGLLAVESVINYSKERVSRHYERKMEQQRRNSLLLQNAGQGLVQTGFKYDQINFESDSDDEEGFAVFISDDEDLEESGVLQSLKTGRLPVDIRAMHAVCLLGAGGQDFVALNYVDKLLLSNEIDLFNNDNSNRDASIVIDDLRWAAFSKQFNAPVNKSSMLACIADIVKDNGKDQSRSNRVLRMFRKHLMQIDSNQGRNKGLDDALASSNELNRDHILRILLTALKLMVDCAKADLAILSDEPSKEDIKIIEKAVSDSIYTLEMMLRFQLWNPSYSDWSLPQTSMDMVSILACALSNLVQAASICKDTSLVDLIQVGSMKARHLISTICQADSTPSKEPTTSSVVESWRSFPLPFSWQNGFHEKISLRAYNLCVACCVSQFSGWEPSEFTLDLLRSSDNSFFGVTLEGASVAGFLPQSVASTIGEQWELVSLLLKNMDVLPFEVHLDERTKMNWYEKAMKIIEKQNIGSISSFGEDDGIKALLSFSKLCLLSAQNKEDNEKDELLKLSFSVLLPVTQFCIDKQVWQSSIGTAVISSRNEMKMGYYLDENCRWLGPTKSNQGRMLYTNKTNRPPRPRPPKVTKQAHKRVQPSSAVKVPTSILLELWTTQDGDSPQQKGEDALQNAQLAMKKVDDAMKNLRKSRTLNSLERASIDVALALLALATFEQCHNPFVCLQQAAMFAAMGSKRGNNDEPFKRFLPLKSKCSPLEALNILGRADCLRAIHFLQEAQFLCTWVASVCHSHREQLEDGMTWDSRWEVIGYVNYTVASYIDETSAALSQDLCKWDELSKREFDRGKSDGQLLVEVPAANEVEDINEPSNRDNLMDDGDDIENDEVFGVEQGDLTGLNQQFEYQNDESQVVAVDNEGYYDDPYAGIDIVGI